MYLKVVELAESLGVEESVIEGWIRHEGLPCVEDRGRLLFDRAQVITWASERGLAAKAGFLAPARATQAERGLPRLLQAGGIWRHVSPSDLAATLECIIGTLPGATPEVRRLLAQRLRAPGGITWAPVGEGLALPHLRTPVTLGRDAGLLALLFLNGPCPMHETAPDDIPVTRLLFFVAPSPRAHLDLLGQLSKTLVQGGLKKLILEAAPDAALLAALEASALPEASAPQPEAGG